MTVVFKDINWLNALGGLDNARKVLEYFYHSPFYDKASDNEALRQQGAMGVVYEHFLDLRGTQYLCNEMISSFPNDLLQKLYIVKKIRRSNNRNYDVLDVYYCIGGEFYKSPDFYELLKTRYQVTGHRIKQCFDSLTVTFHDTTNSLTLFPYEGNPTYNKLLRLECFDRCDIPMSLFPGMNNMYAELEVFIPRLVKKPTEINEVNMK